MALTLVGAADYAVAERIKGRAMSKGGLVIDEVMTVLLSVDVEDAGASSL